MEGDLRKSPVSSGKSMKRKKMRRFFLFTDMLMYTEHNAKKNIFQYKGSFFLHPDEYTLSTESGNLSFGSLGSLLITFFYFIFIL